MPFGAIFQKLWNYCNILPDDGKATSRLRAGLALSDLPSSSAAPEEEKGTG